MNKLNLTRALLDASDEERGLILLRLVAKHPSMMQRICREELADENPSINAVLANAAVSRPTAVSKAVDPTELLRSRIKPYADAGQKIQAIKALRQITGMGLADSKRWVEEQFTWPVVY